MNEEIKATKEEISMRSVNAFNTEVHFSTLSVEMNENHVCLHRKPTHSIAAYKQ